MSQHHTATMVGYGLMSLILVPVIIGVLIVVVTAMRERYAEAHRRGEAKQERRLRERLRGWRKAPHVVERSPSGTVRVTKLPGGQAPERHGERS